MTLYKTIATQGRGFTLTHNSRAHPLWWEIMTSIARGSWPQSGSRETCMLALCWLFAFCSIQDPRPWDGTSTFTASCCSVNLIQILSYKHLEACLLSDSRSYTGGNLTDNCIRNWNSVSVRRETSNLANSDSKYLGKMHLCLL